MTLLPVIIEVALGTALIFLILSGICSTLADLLSNVLDLRSRYLQKGIAALLSDSGEVDRPDQAPSLAAGVMAHPLMQKLDASQGGNRLTRGIQRLTNMGPISLVPSVPPDTFASVVVDQLKNSATNYGSQLTALRMRVRALGSTTGPGKPLVLPSVILEACDQRESRVAIEQMRQGLPLVADEGTRNAIRTLVDTFELDQVRQGVTTLPPSRAHDVLAALVKEAENETQKIEHLKGRIATWFDGGMSQVSAWYKHNISYFLVAFAVIVCLTFNADVFRIVNTLWHDPILREALVARAEAATSQPTDGQVSYGSDGVATSMAALEAQLEQVGGLPLGWDCEQVNAILRDGSRARPVGLIDSVQSPGMCEQVDRVGPGGQTQIVRLEGGAVNVQNLFVKLGGLALMSVGVSLGAGFWYRMLKQLLALRSDKTS